MKTKNRKGKKEKEINDGEKYEKAREREGK